MAGLPKTDLEKRAVRKQVGPQHAFFVRENGNVKEEIDMARIMRFDGGSSVQYGLGEYPLGDSLDIPGNGQGAESKVKVLRLVMTPVEGCELLRRLKGDPLTSDVPVIVLTR
jgi:CheY-like chemotaxis protein